MRTVFALIRQFEDAQTAVRRLQEQGFEPLDISVIVQSQAANKDELAAMRKRAKALSATQPAKPASKAAAKSATKAAAKPSSKAARKAGAKATNGKAKTANGKAKAGSSMNGYAIRDLHEMLSRQRPWRVTDAGSVFAANAMATEIAEIAGANAPAAAEGGLKYALQDFGLPAHVAEGYQTGIEHGWLLLFVRTKDERALEAHNILRAHNGRDTLVQPYLAV